MKGGDEKYEEKLKRNGKSGSDLDSVSEEK